MENKNKCNYELDKHVTRNTGKGHRGQSKTDSTPARNKYGSPIAFDEEHIRDDEVTCSTNSSSFSQPRQAKICDQSHHTNAPGQTKAMSSKQSKTHSNNANASNNSNTSSIQVGSQLNTNFPSDQSKPNPNAGVADYFAILGMGEHLVLKHSQKKKGDAASCISSEEKNSNDVGEEDEAQMMERFYREIVEVRIFRKKIGTNIKKDGKTRTEKNLLNDSRFIYIQSQSCDENDGASNRRAENERSNPAQKQELYFDRLMEGFTILDRTIPAGLPLRQSNNNISSSDSHNLKQCWKTGQSFTGDLNPLKGLHFDFISSIREDPSLSDVFLMNEQPALQTRSTKFRNQLLFRDSSISFLSQTRSGEAGDGAETADASKIPHNSFFLGYRRRGADEGDQPAISKMQLFYASVPVQEKSQSLNSNRFNRFGQDDSVHTIAERLTIDENQPSSDFADNSVFALKRGLVTGAGLAARAGIGILQRNFSVGSAVGSDTSNKTTSFSGVENTYRDEGSTFSGIQNNEKLSNISVPLKDLLEVPDGYDELIIPSGCDCIRVPSMPTENGVGDNVTPDDMTTSVEEKLRMACERRSSQRRFKRSFLFANQTSEEDSPTSGGEGSTKVDTEECECVEAWMSNSMSVSRSSSRSPEKFSLREQTSPIDGSIKKWSSTFVKFPISMQRMKLQWSQEDGRQKTEFIPIVAIRRQRIGDEERFHEDPAMIDVALTFSDVDGRTVMPSYQHHEDDEDEQEGISILSKLPWAPSGLSQNSASSGIKILGSPELIGRWNVAMGFADMPFKSSTLDRFPKKNYKGLPLPEEELPMFCYPTGCRLHRKLFREAPLPGCYGFVVKNERGHSLYVSCVSFMEPLTAAKKEQLNKMSERWRRTSLPHRRFCERRDEIREQRANMSNKQVEHPDANDDEFFLTGFDEMMTFENKTICLISRYPHWTAFRRFLSHLHLLSCSSSDIPLERYISHLLLSVPMPKPGGSAVVVPLSTLPSPMVMDMPPLKDLPLMDLPYRRLFACLDVPMVVTVVIGFLALEHKVILMSSHPSLVLDGCELLRSLLFPFELCAPYVPRLTQPFMSCLEFPGAIFVGIHDDGKSDGLAQLVRADPPEDSVIIDLDTGELDSHGDRMEVLKQFWGIIPSEQRAVLVTELETLCKDAGIVPGQEPIDAQIDSSFNVSLPSTALVNDLDQSTDTSPAAKTNLSSQHLDDRAVRDAFLRFFCSVLGGYERYLVVPDVDFLISGNEWFDSQRFLATAHQDVAPFLGSLVTTQLFQSYIQRRTEASDVHCMLFDECLTEFHSSPDPYYGRLGIGENGSVLTPQRVDDSELFYSLLVDQCATEVCIRSSSTNNLTMVIPADHSMIDGDQTIHSTVEEDYYHRNSSAGAMSTNGSDADLSITIGNGAAPGFRGGSFQTLSTTLNSSSYYGVISGASDGPGGDILTSPCRKNLPENYRFVYVVDGNPCFPQKLDETLFLPCEPEILKVDNISEVAGAILTRNDREIDEANRRRKLAMSYGGGLKKQRRCMWQFPKLLASHVLGSWMLCIPAQVSQPRLSSEQKSCFLLRALGAMKVLRSRHRIIADEAAYRALMVACGRTDSDRRIEIVKLFGMIRNDGIFPSAVTLGQYTKAIAEGFSKRSIDVDALSTNDYDSRDKRVEASPLSSIDENISKLEEHGRRWRQRHQNNQRGDSNKNSDHVEITEEEKNDKKVQHKQVQQRNQLQHNQQQEQQQLQSLIPQCTDSFSFMAQDQEKEKVNEDPKKAPKKSIHAWNPILHSTSFVPNEDCIPESQSQSDHLKVEQSMSGFRFLSIWSRATVCNTCQYIPLDEEIQAGWDYKSGSEDEMTGAIQCPRCQTTMIPMLAYREMTFEDIENLECNGKHDAVVEKASIPAQLTTSLSSLGRSNTKFDSLENAFLDVDDTKDEDPNYSGFVTYMSPPMMRATLERHIEDFGEDILQRETLRCVDPTVYYNIWWYCLRFSLPLPLPVRSLTQEQGNESNEAKKNISKALNTTLHCPVIFHENYSNINYCAFGAWDQSLALEGCKSGAKCVSNFLKKMHAPCDDQVPMTLLAHFNLQTYAQNDWNTDLSEILVALVEACDKRDFVPVLETVIRCNKKRSSKSDTKQLLDTYRTVLYLSKYQCTTAFHVFFPAICKACKGYHFWCANGTPLPVFDWLYRDAVLQLTKQQMPGLTGHFVNENALGFRCIFGHII